MSFRNPFGQYYNHADHIASMLLVFFLFVFVCLYSTRVRADDALAGFGAAVDGDLDPHQHVVPDLSTEEYILEWGKKIIDGEQKRMANGGFPIYNPAINKVKVHYDIFCEHQRQHTFHMQNTERVQGDLGPLRAQADEIILNLWNIIEDYYKDLLPYARMMKCQLYGVIYYYRKGERKLTADSDRELKRIMDSQPTFQWSAEE